MRNNSCRWLRLLLFALLVTAVPVSCRTTAGPEKKITVPAGYYQTLQIIAGGSMYRFGPFVGYYFRPDDPEDLSRLSFLCYNEKQFYTRGLPADTLLFSGQARMVALPETGLSIPAGSERIIPVFADSIPEAWLATRPEPQSEYRHFHSCHDDRGAVLLGYWLRHVGKETFTYDMGGRVGLQSPLYHEVMPGVDLRFPVIVEFDYGRQVEVQ